MNKAASSTTHSPVHLPKTESFWTHKTAANWVINVLTLGTYGAVSVLSSKYCIERLEAKTEHLKNQIDDIQKKWRDLESELLQISEDIKEDQHANSSFAIKIKNASSFIDLLQSKKIHVITPSKATFSENAKTIIFFVGELVANILSLGIYGTYQQYALKNRASVLQVKTNLLETTFNSENEMKAANLKKLSTFVESYILNKQDLEKISHTPAAQAHNALKKSQQDFADIQNKYDQIKQTQDQAQQQITSLRTQTQVAQNDLLNVQNQLKLKDSDLNNLQQQLNDAKKEASRVQSVIDNQGKVASLTKELGPIPSQYKQRMEDKETIGAMDVENSDFEDDGVQMDLKTLNLYQDYNNRYGDARSAADIVKASFSHAFTTLISMAAKSNKIKLNKSADTPRTAGGYAVYRYMILDLLAGGKVAGNGCHGFQLKINDNVSMLPSLPEKILQSKNDQTGKSEFSVVQRFKQCDDFTPDYEALRNNGVDAPAAKWILEQLSEEEKGYLFTHLMAPVIENSHSDYIKMQDFMRNLKTNPRAKLVETASQLIQNMAEALGKKFLQNVLIPCWRSNADDEDMVPFVKVEDDTQGIDKIQDTDFVLQSGPKVQEWTMQQTDFDEEFFISFIGSQLAYKNTFKNMGSTLLKPQQPGKEFPKISWITLQDQYHRSHEMVGSKITNGDLFQGPHHCLFSNLMAVLCTEKSQLNTQNTQELRNAMGKYLERIRMSEEFDDVKQMKFFENTIKKTHKCDVDAYINWLKWADDRADVDMNNLTSLEILLCAHTVGIKIGIFRINESQGVVDKNGRIVPEIEYYGPNTDECLLLASFENSYYGLFPKLKTDGKNLSHGDKQELQQLEAYWKSINT